MKFNELLSKHHSSGNQFLSELSRIILIGKIDIFDMQYTGRDKIYEVIWWQYGNSEWLKTSLSMIYWKFLMFSVFWALWFLQRGFLYKNCVLCCKTFRYFTLVQLFLLRFRILELRNRVTKLSYTKWRHTSSY